jgi:hypothetical protein
MQKNIQNSQNNQNNQNNQKQSSANHQLMRRIGELQVENENCKNIIK